tara:strand:+ start:452 stop:775 length:324 start_codon:yes stop_codon:yes gene_type:complete
MSELGKRAVACRHCHWMPGMLSKDTGLRLDEMTDEWEGAVPDLTDPATLGCLLALVREAYKCPWLSVVGSADGLWRIDAEGSDADVSDLHSFGSEAEALVAALEAAE